MAYKIIDGYSYPSQSNTVGGLAVVVSLLLLMVVLYFTGVFGTSLTEWL